MLGLERAVPHTLGTAARVVGLADRLAFLGLLRTAQGLVESLLAIASATSFLGLVVVVSAKRPLDTCPSSCGSSFAAARAEAFGHLVPIQ